MRVEEIKFFIEKTNLELEAIDNKFNRGMKSENELSVSLNIKYDYYSYIVPIMLNLYESDRKNNDLKKSFYNILKRFDRNIADTMSSFHMLLGLITLDNLEAITCFEESIRLEPDINNESHELLSKALAMQIFSNNDNSKILCDKYLNKLKELEKAYVSNSIEMYYQNLLSMLTFYTYQKDVMNRQTCLVKIYSALKQNNCCDPNILIEILYAYKVLKNKSLNINDIRGIERFIMMSDGTGITANALILMMNFDKNKSIDIIKNQLVSMKNGSQTLTLYQYKSIESGLKAIETGSILLGNPNSFNDCIDPFYRLFNKSKHRDAIFLVMENFGIACLSDTPYKQLMWSHYARNHQGVCIEYEIDTRQLDDGIVIKKITYTNNKIKSIGGVIYNYEKGDGDIPRFSHKSFVDELFTKDKLWDYENETRVIGYTSNKEGGKLKKGVKIKSIYLGREISDKNKIATEIQREWEKHNSLPLSIHYMCSDDNNLRDLKSNPL